VQLAEQWSSIKGDLKSSVTGEVAGKDVTASDFIFVPQYVIVVGLHLNGALCALKMPLTI
jgi:hypothetical protein